MSTSMIPIIALGSAGLYSVAMIAMKFWWKLPHVGLGLLIVAARLAEPERVGHLTPTLTLHEVSLR